MKGRCCKGSHLSASTGHAPHTMHVVDVWGDDLAQASTSMEIGDKTLPQALQYRPSAQQLSPRFQTCLPVHKPELLCYFPNQMFLPTR